MSAGALEALALALRSGSTPDGVEILKDSPVRIAAVQGDVFVKVFRKRRDVAEREARNLRRAGERGLPVPAVRGHGPDWIALERLDDPREATRADLPLLLDLARQMHAAGLFHGDFHRGNLVHSRGQLWLLDLQRSRFLPHVPRALRLRDLGFLAYSLGEPLPPELEEARAARDRRAHVHWRSRTRRCRKESSGFTAWRMGDARGFRAREIDGAQLAEAVARTKEVEPFKRGRNGTLWRCDPWVLKRHAHVGQARRAWIGGHGLEARGIATGRAVGWAGPWLIMRDAGPTLIDWVEGELARAPEHLHREMARQMGELLARLHRRGIYHADLKANNIAWTPGSEPRLLDYGRVHFARRVSRRRRIKNLAQLNAALPDPVGPAVRELALGTYLDAAETRDARHELRAEVIAESLRRNHRWSGCGRP